MRFAMRNRTIDLSYVILTILTFAFSRTTITIITILDDKGYFRLFYIT